MKAVIYPFAPKEPSSKLTEDFPQLQWATVSSPDELAREVGEAAIYVTSNRVCTPAVGAALRQGRALRWVHFTSAGIERGVAMGLPDGVTVTNSTGLKTTMVAEHAMTLLLALARHMPASRVGQTAHRWLREEITRKMGTLEGATVCIIGLGNIGRELARKLKAFDAHPIGISRAGKVGGDIEAVFPRERFKEALALADFVAVTTSGDESSLHMIGAAELAAMKATAFIVNVARGNIIVEADLIDALEAGRIAGAGLDVADAEPPAAENPLWDMPNVIMTPHIAGGGSTGYPQQEKLFGENLERFHAGKPMLNECPIPAKV